MSKRVKVDLPEPASKIMQQLARGHDAAVAFAAPNTIAILKRVLLEHLQDSQDCRDLNGRQEIIAVPRRNSRRARPTSLCYHVARPDASQYSDVHLTVMTEFITGVLPLIPNLTGPSREDLDIVKKTLDELCRCLDSKKFSDSVEQNFVEVYAAGASESGSYKFN